MFENIGYSYKVGKFNAMYNRAKEIIGVVPGADQDNVSVRAFL